MYTTQDNNVYIIAPLGLMLYQPTYLLGIVMFCVTEECNYEC